MKRGEFRKFFWRQGVNSVLDFGKTHWAGSFYHAIFENEVCLMLSA